MLLELGTVAVVGGLGWLAAKRRKKGKVAPAMGKDAGGGWKEFGPDTRTMANTMVQAIKWQVFTGTPVVVYKGSLTADAANDWDSPDWQALRAQNAEWMKTLRGQGYVFAVTADVVVPDMSRTHYLVLFPPGTPVKHDVVYQTTPAIPLERANEVMLLPAAAAGAAPGVPTCNIPVPPGGAGGAGGAAQGAGGGGGGGGGATVNVYTQPPGGGGVPGGGPAVPGVAFEEISDPTLRQKVRQMAQSNSVGLRDLDELAKMLDAEGYAATAEAVRKRRGALAITRAAEAKERGGYLFTVRSGDLPGNVAKWYGGPSAKRLTELQQVNGNRPWKAFWLVGDEVLLPEQWGDPTLKGLPPAAGGGGGTVNNQGGGGGAPIDYTKVPYPTPWGPYLPGGKMLPPNTSETPIQGYFPYPVPSSPTGVLWGPKDIEPQADNAAAPSAPSDADVNANIDH